MLREMTNKTKFSCKRCGQCCRMMVVLNKEDILRLKKRGMKLREFSQADPLHPKRRIMRQENGACAFLVKEGKEGFGCWIYPLRPEVCRRYPLDSENWKAYKECKPRYWDKQIPLGKIIDGRTRQNLFKLNKYFQGYNLIEGNQR
jgi:Fe-S-cluster containining protein